MNAKIGGKIRILGTDPVTEADPEWMQRALAGLVLPIADEIDNCYIVLKRSLIEALRVSKGPWVLEALQWFEHDAQSLLHPRAWHIEGVGEALLFPKEHVKTLERYEMHDPEPQLVIQSELFLKQ